MDRTTAHIESAPWSADPLDRLSDLREARNLINYLIDKSVGECRNGGEATSEPDAGGERVRPVSWERISDALGISRQAAWGRYRHMED